MDRVRKPNISESYTPSSESYSNYLHSEVHRFLLWLPPCVLSSPRSQFSPDPKNIWHDLARQQQCQKFLVSSWTTISHLRVFLFCSTIPMMDPCFFSCEDSCEKHFWIRFIRSKILLEKLNPTLPLKWSHHSRRPNASDLRHSWAIMEGGWSR
jgi:hypothetical protein